MRGLVAAWLVGWCGVAEAATLRVGAIGTFTPGAAPHATISAAVAAANPGDVIEIGSGIWDETVTVTESITLRSVAPPNTPAVLSRSAAATALTVRGGAVMTVDGVHLRGGAGGRRCMQVTEASQVTLDGVVFTDCTHNDSGAALHVAAGAGVDAWDVELTTTVDPISAPDKGGGLVWLQGRLTLHGGRLQGGVATRGGAVWVDGGEFVTEALVTGALSTTTDFLDNHAVRDGALDPCGGAVCVTSGTVSLRDAYLAGNSSARGGGHIGLSGGALYDVDSAFVEGVAVRGGAIWATGGAVVTLDQTRVRGNLAAGAAADLASGGGVYADGSGPITAIDVQWLDNDADARGGAVWIGGAGSLVVQGGEIRDGIASAGAAVWVGPGVTAGFSGVAFERNAASRAAVPARGGALALDRPGAATIGGCTFEGNSATDRGGAVWWAPASAAATLTVTSSRFVGQTAGTGGAVAVEGSGSATARDVVFEANTATTGAGWHQTGGTLSLVRADLCRNVASGDGGGLWLGATSATVRSAVFNENRAAQGGAARISGGGAVLQHITALGQQVVGAGAAAIAADRALLELRDAVIASTVGGRGAAVTNPVSTVATHDLFWANASGDVAGFVPTQSMGVEPALEAWSRNGDCADDRPWPRWSSPLRDAASGGVDADGTPADIGAFGGADAAARAPWTTDGDLDGTVTLADCDDGDAAFRIGAVEVVADGIDQDCDRRESCYVDGDGDGFGGAATTSSMSLTCAASGVAAVSGDCDDADAEERPGVQWYRDADRDGWGGVATSACARTQASDVNRPGDCADGNAGRHPDAVEVVADGVDSDCDGLEDCYADADGDGAPGTTRVAVASPTCVAAGVGPRATDCDDGDAAERPGVTWYPDADRDGFGSSAAAGSACARAAPTDVADRADCDDARADVRPGAPEQPGDGVDSDCDARERCYQDLDGDGFGRATTRLSATLTCVGAGISASSQDCDDEASDDTVADQAALKYPGARHFRDADGDGYGRASTSLIECDLSPGYVVLGTDCDDDPADDPPGRAAPRIHPGASYLPDTDGDTWGADSGAVTPTTCGVPAGHVTRGGDCAPTDALVYPGAPYHPDVDGDGFGDASRSVASPGVCAVPAGLVPDGSDCDDTDPAIRPGGTYWRDRDGDGYGGAGSLSSPAVCAPPAGYVVAGGDCVDDPAVPDASGIRPGATYWRDVDGDGYGRDGEAVTPATCGKPAGYAARPGDCDDDPADDAQPGDAAATWPGAVYYRDADGDGWGAAAISDPAVCARPAGFAARGGDCDDDASDDVVGAEAARTFPGATYWLDLDGDGFGQTLVFVSAPSLCVVPDLYSTRDGDCDDLAADDTVRAVASRIYPGATYWRDLDGDGWGTADEPVTPAACGLPDGASVRDDDCDDEAGDDVVGRIAARIHPGASYLRDADGDGYGVDGTAAVADCAVPPGRSTDGGDCDDDASDDRVGAEASSIFPGARYFPDEDGDRFGRTADGVADPELCLPPAGFTTRGGDCDDDPSDDTPERVAAGIWPGATAWRDVDGDGWGAAAVTVSCALADGVVTRGGDCDDTPDDDAPPRVVASRIWPGAPYWPDVDGDGWGRDEGAVDAACEVPPGWSPTPGDCDDTPEDDAPPRRVAALTWPGAPLYLDADGDGFGRDDDVRRDPSLCAIPADRTPTGGDCDDVVGDDAPAWPAAAVYPGAPVWSDADGDGWGAGPPVSGAGCGPVEGRAGRAGDCDDDPADDTVASVAAAIFPGATYRRDRDGDGHGGSEVAPSSCALPAGASVTDDDCDDDPTDDRPGREAAGVYPGAACFRDADGDGWGVDDGTCPGACPLPEGYVIRSGDCDDDPTDDAPGQPAQGSYPGAPWWADRDGDGWGDDALAGASEGCDRPDGVVSRPGDCDDDPTDDLPGRAASGLHPGALVWPDVDGDSWGDDAGAAPLPSCDAAGGVATRPGDCDDQLASTSPGAVEVPGVGGDEDCDGAAACWADADGDGWGTTATVVDQATPGCVDPGEAVDGGDCDDDASDDALAPAAARHPSAVETCGDGIDSDCSCAGDGSPDFVGMVGCGEGDEDGDGLDAAAERALGTSDCDRDVDADGLDDAIEVLLGTDPRSPDSDGDGVPDGDEVAGGQHLHTDCAPDLPAGTVCDDLPDALDPDDDGDGIPTAVEGATDIDCAAPEAGDFTRVGDGRPSHRDADADGDGRWDGAEGGDADGDGIVDWRDCEVGDAGGDPDCDGLTNQAEATLPGGPTDPRSADSDGDGVLDGVEAAGGARVDTDGDGVIDALDPDDDGDGVPTRAELGLRCADGSVPEVIGDEACGAGPSDPLGPFGRCADGTAPAPANHDAPTGGAWPRHPDALPDWLDADDDGDGVPTAEEAIADPRDGDGDGVADAWDPDDADGPDGDRDADGWSNADEAEVGSDPLDPDSDGDGLPDGVEGASDPDDDGVPALLDPDDDDDGLPTAEEGDADIDGDGVPSHLDDDADGDGVLDRDEGLSADADCDGTPDAADPVDDDGPCARGDGVSEAPLDDATAGCACRTSAPRAPGALAWGMLAWVLRRRRG